MRDYIATEEWKVEKDYNKLYLSENVWIPDYLELSMYIIIVGGDATKFDANEKTIDEIWGSFGMYSGGASGNSWLPGTKS